MQPIIELKSELEGIIKLEIIKEDGTLKDAEGLNIPFMNLITDAGLNYINDTTPISTACAYCKVGTSSAIPTVSDTSLGSQTGSASQSGTTADSIQYTTEPYYSEHTNVYTFTVGSVSGNLTEIGFFSYGGTMWSRALIKDSGGNPTTLTLLTTEQLRVTYTVRRYIPASLTGSFTLNTNGTNSTINYTITPANISSTSVPWYGGWCSQDNMYVYACETQVLSGITSEPAGTRSSDISGSGVTYVLDSFQRDFVLNIPVGTANFTTGIGSVVFWARQSVSNYRRGYQCSFSPKIMKTSSQTLAIGIRLSWGRTTQQ